MEHLKSEASIINVADEEAEQAASSRDRSEFVIETRGKSDKREEC
jgi:hypothetical protein